MVKLTFKFNEDKVHEAGYTTDELLEPMREHAEKYGIDEVEYGVFAKDGIYALGAIERYVVNVSREFLDYLDTWIMDEDGEIEDCKCCLLDCMEEYETNI
ncbi:MAG: hypothetical protein ACI39Q_07495 [Wujia sp.]